MIKTGIQSFDDAVGGIDLRKTYLISGNKESGKEDFSYRLVASALRDKNAVIYVTTGKTVNDVIASFQSRQLNISQYMGNSFKIIDAYSRSISPQSTDNSYTKMLNGPLDLTGISVALSAMNAEMSKEGVPVLNVIDSISVLMLYNNPTTIYRFLQFVCGRSKMAGISSVFLIDDEMHSPEVNETIKSIMDSVIMLRLENGKRSFKVLGNSKEVLDWKDI
ncbi:MAG: RAD55 family ATPase [Candidatus Parvarchaeota archaeon]|nr:RAD55 family ATPase [Candidatus Parvarchaeota archaeon]